jgi:ribosomal protein L31
VNPRNLANSFTSNSTTKKSMLSTSTTSSAMKKYSPVFRFTLRWNSHLVFHIDILPLLHPSYLITNKRCSA